MLEHLQGREQILSFLKSELVGPSPQGSELACDKPLTFREPAEAKKPWRQADSGEEIIQRDTPLKRYGVGVLYPMGTEVALESQLSDEASSGAMETSPFSPEEVAKGLDSLLDRVVQSPLDGDDDDFDLTPAQSFHPSSVGVSFLATFPPGTHLRVEARGGRYRPVKVRVADKDWTWHLRSPVTLSADFSTEAILGTQGRKVEPSSVTGSNLEGLSLSVEVFARPHKDSREQRLLTVCLVNRTQGISPYDSSCLFQTEFQVTVVDENGTSTLLPYPGPPADKLDPEEQSLALLYHLQATYAVGHGCAADWGTSMPGSAPSFIRAQCVPAVETPSITPDILDDQGRPIDVSMAPLAGLVSDNDGFTALEQVVARYESWISRRREELLALEPRYQAAGEAHLADCERCAIRMRSGLAYLRKNEDARLAFQLANHAMLLQQIRTERREPRLATFLADKHVINFDETYEEITYQSKRGRWRAFQIAFLLMAIESTANGDHGDRETVELIWFPTGGGKTEAYLGLAAFALFLRRLRAVEDDGVHVLMRYTLRLLTAQQFQRASSLICAMEYLRREHKQRLGEASFSIGIWLGGDTTPNQRKLAKDVLTKLRRGDVGQENLFILTRCPWCRAQMGPLKHVNSTNNAARKIPRGARGGTRQTSVSVLGYLERGETVGFHCPDRACDFADNLPIYVIDEDLYDLRPSLVIGTVDKFATLAWRPGARALFGIGPDGNRICSPPGLIIQDELHLISGPLGSMVGLYEAVIEELCTDRRGKVAIKPKLVCSTATIRRYAEQIKALYARQDPALFPPPGLHAGDSFFAQYARDENGTLKPGRLFVGINASGLSSFHEAQTRAFSSLLQAPQKMEAEEKDPWWSLLIFFNSLRELGTGLTMFQAAIPYYLKAFHSRTGEQTRSLLSIMELTSRLKSDEVPAAIAALEVTTSQNGKTPVDACLASNIIEVGVDIDRLSLMAIVSQPKTTAQYIQVSGRVGRRWWERPGLVLTLYSPTKPRDRSHFEQFRTYHERLYAQVEPSSVTPFAPPMLDRALHAVMAAYARQSGDESEAESPTPFPQDLVEHLRRILLPRLQVVDPREISNFEKVFHRRAQQWQQWQRLKWSSNEIMQDTPMLRLAGSYAPPDYAALSWPTPTSMRNVDAQCQIEITQLYLMEEGECLEDPSDALR